GVMFGASSLYLVLKVGITVSASIPVAVISLTLFRLWSKMGGRDATILENNIVQTAGSGGESIAFGLGVTMPAIMILGFDLEISGDLPRIARCGLYHRASYCFDPDGWRRAQCPGLDPADQVLRCGPSRRACARRQTDCGHEPRSNPQRLHSVHWRRSGRGRRH